MLNICTDGRTATLSMRLVSRPAATTARSTPPQTARQGLGTDPPQPLPRPDTGQDSPIPGALQIVFCDLATPLQPLECLPCAARHDRPRIAAEQHRFIHDAATDADKAKVFAACRNGHVAVLIGSTRKMGVGTNIQTRAVHLMDLDAPWRPADVAQSHGRILRQGNQHPEISITQVITENSFDAYMWQPWNVRLPSSIRSCPDVA